MTFISPTKALQIMSYISFFKRILLSSLWMFLMFLWTFSFSPLGRSGVINHPYKCSSFSCVLSLQKKSTTGLSFSLRSNIKAHIRLQSNLNFWTAGFIILLFRKRAWFYRIDSNSLACPDSFGNRGVLRQMRSHLSLWEHSHSLALEICLCATSVFQIL